MTSAAPVTLVHTSDLHLGAPAWGRPAGDELLALRRVLAATRTADADVLVVAGDLFDDNRVPDALLDTAVGLLVTAQCEVVVLPGNHDCLVDQSVYLRAALAERPNVTVLGLNGQDAVDYPRLDLEIWGRAHRDYADMLPLADPPSRRRRYHVAVAHGHWVRTDHDRRYGWLIGVEDVRATRANYVALGHWDVARRVPAGDVLAYYSGSPDVAGTVNVVRLSTAGSCCTRHPLPSVESVLAAAGEPACSPVRWPSEW